MRDSEFKELVDLYLDKEIDGAGIERLRTVVTADESRRREFEAACQLHHAMRLALGKEVAANEARNPLPFHRLLVTAGMAASFVLGGFLLAPAFNETGDVDSLDEAVTVASKLSNASYSVDNLPVSLQRQLAEMQDVQTKKMSTSLAARLRLAGLSPELEPTDVRLKNVQLEARRIHIVWDGSSGNTRQVHRHTSFYFTPESGPPAELNPQLLFHCDSRSRLEGMNALAGGPFRFEAKPVSLRID